MKKLIFSIFLLGLLTLTPAPTLAAAEKIQLRGIGVTGDAFFTTDNCIYTFVLFAAEERRDSTAAGKHTFAEVYYWRQDRCHQDDQGYPIYLLNAHNRVEIPDRDFSVKNNLTSATLNTIIPVIDTVPEPDQTLNLVIHMKWTANGKQERYHNNDRSTYGNITVISHSNSIYQPVSASGSVSLNGVNLIKGQALSTSPIAKSSSVTITVTH